MAFYDKFVIKPGTKVDLDTFDPDDTAGWTKEKALARISENHERMKELQEVMYAEHKHSLCAMFQAVDAAGKDGAVNNNGSVMNIEGVSAVSLKQPSKRELDQDFLWRVEQVMPQKGNILFLNRTQEEDVLVTRVKHLVSKKIINKRYGLINDFENRHMINGTTFAKFYLLISQEEQWKRFGARAGDPDKLWKLADGKLKEGSVDLAKYAEKLKGLKGKKLVKTVKKLLKKAKKNEGEYEGGDLLETNFWKAHRKAANIALTRNSKEGREWIVVPSNNKWFRDLVVSEVLKDKMEAMEMKFPPAPVNTDRILERHFSGKKWKHLRDIFNEAREKAANDALKRGKHKKPEHQRAQAAQAQLKHG